MLVGFSLLALADQMTLLQKTWLDVLCLNFAYRSSAKPGTLVFSEDFKVAVSTFVARPHMPTYEGYSFVKLYARKMWYNMCFFSTALVKIDRGRILECFRWY